jgi:uncharacterized protein YhbP (UPF0306 family)
MMKTNLKFNHSKYSDETINKSISEILNANTLGAISNIRKTDEGIESWISTVFYAFNSSSDIYILTEPFTQHIKNLAYSKSTAMAICESNQEPTKDKRGLQIFGECARAKGRSLLDGYRLYAARFLWLPDFIKKPEDFAKGIIQSKLFVIHPKEIKIFDEPTFGKEIWITVSIKG